MCEADWTIELMRCGVELEADPLIWDNICYLVLYCRYFNVNYVFRFHQATDNYSFAV